MNCRLCGIVINNQTEGRCSIGEHYFCGDNCLDIYLMNKETINKWSEEWKCENCGHIIKLSDEMKLIINLKAYCNIFCLREVYTRRKKTKMGRNNG